MMEKYCPLCGNKTDPKIHIKDFGSTSKKIAKLQKKLLIDILKEYYMEQPQTDFVGESIIEMLKK